MTLRASSYRKPLQLQHARISRRGYYIAGSLTVFFWVLLVAYIYNVNNAVVATLAIKDGEKRVAVLEQEVTKLESQLMAVAVGGNLEARAKELGLEAPGTPRFLAGDTIVARLDQ